jgi:quinol-cytochrome oxidoreductase complex cytochrome b subunit
MKNSSGPDLKKSIANSSLWKSIFRHGYADTPRNRVLQVTSNLFLHLHPPKIPKHAVKLRFTWGMGGITFLLFLVTVVTGVVLMFYYRPTGEYAYADMKYLMFDVPFGPLMRNMHRWAAHGMVLCVWFHMLRVFMTGSYKSPREFNWVIGVLLLVLTLLLSFTGYLLPWDQLAVWAVTVGTNMARAVPFLGHEGPFGPETGVTARYDARSILLGGTLVGPPALLRFYVLHCIFIPLAAAVLMALHFWRIRKDGGISSPQLQSEAGRKAGPAAATGAGRVGKVHVWPHLVRVELLIALVVMIVLTVWSVAIDAPLEGPANPTKTPNPAKAPWYFVGLQELLVYFDPWVAGVVLPGLIVLGLIAIPYIDVNPNGNGYYTFSERKFGILTFCFGFFAMWIGLIIIGVFLRGPGWNFFWPWQEWDTHKVVASTNVNLSDLFGISSYGAAAIFGGMVISAYYSLGVVYYLWNRKSDRIRRMGVARYAVMAFFFLTMMAIPVKIVLRLALNVKYVLVTPWFYI